MVMNTPALDRAEAVSDTRVRTLVVDDSPFMLKVLSQILEEASNFDLVGTATDGSQALRYVSMLSPDLVLIDVHMPHLNGIQATRCLKQCEHPPVVVIVSSDDSPVTKAAAEEAGADAFVIKQGNLRHELIIVLQDLFGPKGATPSKTSDIVNERRRPPNNERLDPALDVIEIQATSPCKTDSPLRILSLGSAQHPQARCSQRIQHTVGCSLRQPVDVTRQPLAQLCASSRIQPATKPSSETHDTMKTRRRQGNTGQEKPIMTPDISPTIEEIRRRAHEIFMARGGAPGNELDDWLRAEQELKQERRGTNTNTA